MLMCLDWIKAAEILKKYWHNSAQVDDEHSTDEGTMIVVCMEILYMETTSVYCWGVEFLYCTSIIGRFSKL